MASTQGTLETAKLKSNIEDQLNRLLQQLQDLEDLRDELDDEEYAETRRDTLEQMEVRRMRVRAPARQLSASLQPLIFLTRRSSTGS